MIILLTSRWVVTTNFDNLLEETYEIKGKITGTRRRKLKTQSLPNIELVDCFRRSKKQNVVYLHGHADEEHVVLTRQDYDDYYPSESGKPEGERVLENYLEYIYSNYTIVFVGFSFRDKYVRNHFKRIFRQLVKRDSRCQDKIGYRDVAPQIKHYALLPKAKCDGEQEAVQSEIEEIGINVIHYNEPREWMDCFKKLWDIKPSARKKSGTRENRYI